MQQILGKTAEDESFCRKKGQKLKNSAANEVFGFWKIWESSDSESCDLNRAIPRSLYALIGCDTGCDTDGDSESIFSDSVLLRFDSFFASRCESSGDSRPVILGIMRFVIRDSVPLSSRNFQSPQ